MRTLPTFLLIVVVGNYASAFSPTVHKATSLKIRNSPAPELNKKSPTTLSMVTTIPDPVMLVRGGASVASTVTTSLQSGNFGILGLWAVASSVVVPCTLYRQGWAFSVGYGYSVMAMGLALLYTCGANMTTLSSSLLVTSTIFYGFRLASFIAFRNATVKSKGDQMKSFDKSPALKRIPFAVAVALFYAFMTTPAMYAARESILLSPNMQNVSLAGGAIAWVGAALEALTDTQKYLAKMESGGETKKGKEIFVGPTEFAYRICRHPNYLGELVYWFGLFVGGAPYFGSSIAPWVCSLLGLYGIYGIMTNATKRLDEKQAEKYFGQKKYENWRKSVTAAIFPFVKA